MKKAIIIIPYYGSLPNNFGSFLTGVKNNPQINWLLITDIFISSKYVIPDNLKVINMNFEMVKTRISNVANHDVCCETPYKMCDYKPLYGAAFQDYISNYQYWGYSDMDVIYGRLWHFIKEPIDEGVDKIGEWGHLTLFKNNEQVNKRFMLSITEGGHDFSPFARAMTTNQIVHFDETDGINKIYSYYKFSVYTNDNLVNDIFFENLDLISNDKRFFGLPGLFAYVNGKTLYYYQKHGKIASSEFGYFHFQKRHFECFVDEDVSPFFANTTGYHILPEINDENIEIALETNHSNFIRRVKYLLHSYFKTNWFTNKHIGSVYLPVKYIYWRIFKEKNFIV